MAFGLSSVVFGLASAASWGMGDFAGGIASKRSHVFGVVFVSQGAGLVVLLGLTLLFGEATPSASTLLWGGAAGLFGAIGLMALYRGLAVGPMGVVAPVAAVVTVVLPVVASFFAEGIPAVGQLAGFCLAIIAVWLVSRTGQVGSVQARELGYAVLAGCGFGLWLVAIDRVSVTAILWPLNASKAVAMTAILVTSLLARQPLIRRQGQESLGRQLGIMILSGICDAGGNAFYALAARTGRLDTSAVLASFHPAITVLLAWILLGERLSRQQALGVIAALMAIALIAAS